MRARVLQEPISESPSSEVVLRFSTIVPFLLLTTVASASPPPPEVLTRVDAAMSIFDEHAFAGSYTITQRSVVSKPNGADREEGLVVIEVSRLPGAAPQRRLIRAVENGEDVTAKAAEDFARTQEKLERKREEEKEDGSQPGSVELQLPSGDQWARLRFSPPRPEAGAMVSPFEPAAGQEGGPAGAGALAWDPETLEPLWLTFSPAANPRFVKELSLRVDFVRLDGHLCAARMVTEGVGKFLLLKRHFRVETEISGLHVPP